MRKLKNREVKWFVPSDTLSAWAKLEPIQVAEKWFVLELLWGGWFTGSLSPSQSGHVSSHTFCPHSLAESVEQFGVLVFQQRTVIEWERQKSLWIGSGYSVSYRQGRGPSLEKSGKPFSDEIWKKGRRGQSTQEGRECAKCTGKKHPDTLRVCKQTNERSLGEKKAI